jgi:hypothetical protein
MSTGRPPKLLATAFGFTYRGNYKAVECDKLGGAFQKNGYSLARNFTDLYLVNYQAERSKIISYYSRHGVIGRQRVDAEERTNRRPATMKKQIIATSQKAKPSPTVRE